MWILTTSGRPEEAAAAVRAIEETCSPEFRGVFCVDGNSEGYLVPASSCWREMLVNSENRGLGARMNWLLAAYASEPFYGWLADDFRPRTRNWDRDLSTAARPNYIAYCNDWWKGPENNNRGVWVQHITSAFAIGGDLVRAVGWFAPPGLRQAGIDSVWNRIGRTNGLMRYLKDTVVEHLHWKNGKRAPDAIDNLERRPPDYVDFIQRELPGVQRRIRHLSETRH